MGRRTTMAEYIKRDVVTKGIMAAKWVDGYDGAMAMEIAASAPTADVVPVVHGQWIEDHDYLKCPECGVMVKCDFTFFDIGNWNYCPNCGAKMQEVE
jgi:hypothetical protein